jgi:hypothetical protein
MNNSRKMWRFLNALVRIFDILLTILACGHECGREAVCDCTICKISFCDTCWGNVHRGVMARHQKLPLRTLEIFQTCDRHVDQALDLFCKDCDCLVCFKCASYGTVHKDHVSSAVEDYAEQLSKKQLRPSGESLKIKVRKFESAMKQVVNKQDQLRKV